MAGASGAALAFLKAFVPSGAGRRPELIDTEPTQETTHARPARAADPGPVSADVRALLRLPPDVEKVLLDIGMPPDDSPVYDGKRRSADKPEEAARKFVIWARAIGAVGSYTSGVICALYGECAAADHRVPVSDNRFLYALKHTAGIRRDLSAPDRRKHLWIIEPAQTIAPKPAPTPKVIAKPALSKPRLFYRFVPEQEFSSPALTQAKAREARRLGRARKQRGSRTHRMS